MPWTRGERVSDPHRERLVARGVDADLLNGLQLRRLSEGSLPEWWDAYDNAIYLRDGFDLPEAMIERMTIYPMKRALIVVGTDIEQFGSLLLGGDDATVFIGADSHMSAAELYCGASSAIILNHGVVATSCAMLDARNGGSIVAGSDQLWAANVYLATDDMHRLEDAATGQRINAFGADIRLGEHVWLGRDVIITGHAEVGDGAVVGMRSLVRGQKVPARSAVAGTPARVIRDGVRWSHDDTP